MTNKPNYVIYIRPVSFWRSPGQLQFQEWVALKAIGGEKETLGDWKEQNPKRSTN